MRWFTVRGLAVRSFELKCAQFLRNESYPTSLWGQLTSKEFYKMRCTNTRLGYAALLLNISYSWASGTEIIVRWSSCVAKHMAEY